MTKKTNRSSSIRSAFILLLCLSCSMVAAQSIEVRGNVSDVSGEVLIGVNVTVKGTTTGAVSDLDGNYVLSLPQGKHTITASFIGYQTQEKEVTASTQLNFVLSPHSIGLDEVVAVGYGTMRKSDLTGAIASVDTKAITETRLSSVNEALQGLVAGVVVSSNSGVPGGDVKIRIRGSNSITGGNDPLVVIDGFAGGDLKSLNPNDIASIEMLKDASATAIYGSRGANGVILVTTKKGKSGKTKIDYNASFGVQKVSRKYDILQAGDYAELVNEKRELLGGTARFSQEEIDYFKQHGGYDWQDEVYRNAMMHNHDISISGGSETVQYLVSAQYLNQQGILKASNYDRFSYRTNLNAALSERLSMGVRLSGAMSKENPYILNTNGVITSNALAFEPTNSIYGETGEYTESEFPTVNNPVADYKELNAENNRDRMSLNAFLQYDVTEKIKFKVSGGLRTSDTENYRYNSKHVYFGVGSNGKANISNGKVKTWQNTNQLTYDDRLGAHKLNVTLVNEQVASHSRRSNLANSNFDINKGYKDVSLGNSPTIPGSTFSNWALMSFLGRVNYAYNDKYLLTASMRADGSSKLAKKWGYFPSASLAWRVTEEAFMDKLHFVSNMKLRLSYGITGSQATGPYQSMSALESGANYAIDGSTVGIGIAPMRFDNPNLGWERTRQSDVGIDLALWDGKVHLTVDYYHKITQDLLLEASVPLYSGFEKELRNVGKVKNSGLDFNVGTNLSYGKFRWASNLNVSKNKSEVLDLGEVDEMFFVLKGGANTNVLRVGETMGLLYGYKYEGVWKTSEADKAALFGNKPGDAKFNDFHKDEKITADDRQVIGCALPDWIIGFSNNFTYGAWDLDFLFTSSIGNDVKNDVYAMVIGAKNIEATHPDVLNRWRPGFEDTDVPGFGDKDLAKQKESSRMVQDGSYLRLKNLTIGYTLSGKALEKIKLDRVRFYVSGQNLLTFTKYKGYDPEVNSGLSDMEIGYDVAPYPGASVFNGGINITF